MKKRILVVEDNKHNLYLATFLLESSGYEVVAAPTGLEAIEIVKVQPLILYSWTYSFRIWMDTRQSGG